ncbi:hypothetical protein GGR92_003283 [Spirosoma lacussanchae]|uniref:SdrD B-like domain-containing protein n=1 Tax=Spirosoma lacussanchae TaxID=1884249 RepID=UPI00110A0612|nr:SdrD B-like domain-containing protein [Spirosoma lacussanchae]
MRNFTRFVFLLWQQAVPDFGLTHLMALLNRLFSVRNAVQPIRKQLISLKEASSGSILRTSRWALTALSLFLIHSALLSEHARAQTCSLTLNPTVSSCYSLSGVSKATVSVEVAWQNAPTNGVIIVNGPTGSTPATATIVTGTFSVSYTSPGRNFTSVQTNVSPQVVSFEIPANGQTGLNVSASFASNASCSAVSGSFSAPSACNPTTCPAGNLGGIVFNDYNSDGIRGGTENSGPPGVTVKVFDCNGAVVGTTTTDIYGLYTLNIPNSAYPVRVEFSNLPAYAGQGTRYGNDGKTTVQFVNAPNCSVDLGILNPSDYCQATPMVTVPCYVHGDPLPGGSTSGSSDALVMFDYGTSGPKDPSKVTTLATAAQVGTLWGSAYDKYKNRLFSSAILRRHAGLGPLGLGGIYVTDMVTKTTTGYINVSAAPLNINVGSIPSNSARGLVTDPTEPSNDAAAFSLIGKVGIGDLEISEDGKFLYFTNLFDKKLYKLDISGTTPTLAGSYNIPATCQSVNSRPFGLKVYRDNVYVGSVCDALDTQNKSDLVANVYKFNPATSSFTNVMSFPLTYPKGPVFVSLAFSSVMELTGWYPWTDTFNDLSTGTVNTTQNSTRLVHPQPILSDIEFDLDGSMILGFADRTGLQVGYANYAPVGTTALYTGFSGGDLLRASFNGNTYLLENNAKVGGLVGDNPNNNQGPGFGEFYNDDFLSTNDILNHSEQVFGALALKPGSGQVIATAMDPINRTAGGSLDAGGVKYFNNTTGQPPAGSTMGFILYTSTFDSTTGGSGTFAKTTGLGDLEITCESPDYLEIGNRVWVDENKNGIQDPCEKSLANVKVALYSGNTLVATTTTDANGEYYFNNNPTSSTATNVASNTTIQPNTAYTVRFGTDGTTNQYDNTTGILTTSIGKFKLTQAFSTQPTANTANDSDAQVISGFAAATVVTGAAGSVNHTIDAGFVCVPTTVASVTTVKATCTGTTANNDAQVLLTGIQGADKAFLVAAGGAIPSYTATGSQPVSNSAVAFTGLANPATSAGQSYSVVLYNGPCCYTVVTTTLSQQTCVVPVCALSLKPTVSGCYQNSGSSKTTVSIEVAWQNIAVSPNPNDASDAITVTFAGQTKTIDPGSYTTAGGSGTIVSPQVVAFEVAADATSQTAQAFIGTDYASASCKAQQTGIVLPAACPPTVCLPGQTGGTVFNDFNADGVKDGGETTGVPGVQVRAYDCNNQLVASTTTDAFGKYVFTNIPQNVYPIRIEFGNLPSYAGMGTRNGADGRTTVQFIQAPDCSVDLGILDNNDYCQTNPKLVIPCYVNGDPLAPLSGTASAGNSDAVVSFDYNVTGANSSTLSAHSIAANTGTLWGMAYNKFTKKVFSSATLKRHAGLGPLGLGGIYVADFSTTPASGSTFAFQPLLDVSTLGINVGSIASNSARGLVADKTQPSEDNAAYLAAGKVGIGGIDLSEDGNKLYLTNLFDNKLYEIDITAYNTSGSLPGSFGDIDHLVSL